MQRPIYHGLTNQAGHIKLFNAEPGDTIYAVHDSLFLWRYQKEVVPPAKKNTADADMIMELKTVDGQYSLLSGIVFDTTGASVYQCIADPLFSSSPHIQVFDDVSESEKQELSESSGVYSTAINNADFSQGQVFFTAIDNSEEEFFVFQDAFIMDVSEQNAITLSLIHI